MKNHKFSYAILTSLLALLAAFWLIACSSGTTGGGGGTGGPAAGTGGIVTGGTGGTGPVTGGTGGVAGTTGGTGGTVTGGTGGVVTGGTGGTGATGAVDGGGTGGITSDGGGLCRDKAEGVYAMKTEIDVWWQDEQNPNSPLVDSGRGKIDILMRGEIKEIDANGNGKGLVHPCGTKLPVFVVDANCTAIAISLPDDMWEKPSMPTFETTGSTTGFNPGDILTIAKTTALIGLSMDDPNGTFPTADQTTTFTCPAGAGVQCFPDMDDDGHPGVTVTIRSDNQMYTQADGAPYKCGLGTDFKYVAAPLSVVGGIIATPAGSAKTCYIGIRNRMGGSGAIADDCMSGTGSAEVDDILNRIADCVHADDTPCSAADADFIDHNTPNYHVLQKDESPPSTWKHPREGLGVTLDRSPSKGPQSTMVRLGDLGQTFSCADVRATNFPPFP